MNETPDEIEMIDRVLEWMSMPSTPTKNVPTVIDRRSIDYHLIKKCVQQEFKHLAIWQFDEYFGAIIHKLLDDKYIEPAYNSELYPNNRVYSISFNGIIFNKKGGYRGQINYENAESGRLKALEENQARNADRMTTLTEVLAYATSALVAIEIIRLFIEHNPFTCH